MIIKAIPSRWLIEEEHRLDCGPFVKGGVEARKAIEGLRCRKDHLVELTQGGLIGIYHVGQDKIVWTEDNIHGMPFLRSADILKADLSYQPFISRKQVAGNHLFQCPTGTTLITRSGSIGRMAYMREDMEDTAISQDVLKVLPDSEKVKPGYLFAFLSSKYGIPIVTGGTFGSIIVHIEAENIADLPVPRLSGVEDQAHEMIHHASTLRTEATKLLQESKTYFEPFTHGLSISRKGPTVNFIQSSQLTHRMDATFHDPTTFEIRSRIIASKHTTIGELCSKVFLPGIFKRIYIENIEYGAYYHSANSVFSIEPKPKAILCRNTNLYNDVLLRKGTILIQAFGQEDGLIGKSALVGAQLDGAATTHMFVRVIANSNELSGYIFAYLSSDSGYAQVAKLPYGGSIPHLAAEQIKNLPIPLLDEQTIINIGHDVLTAHAYRDKAIALESEARTLVERAIEQGAR